jgi:hypothetical protein
LKLLTKAGFVVKLGLENKKKTMWAAGLGVLGLVALAYQLIPLFSGSPTQAASAPATVDAPAAASKVQGKAATKLGKQLKTDNLDPTLRLDLLAASEKTEYEGNGRNIFVSQAEDVVIPKPLAPGIKGPQNVEEAAASIYTPPAVPTAPPIPLKFYGFASSPGEPKKIFLKLNEDVFVAAEGEIVDRRYRVRKISTNSVEIEDVVNSGPPQNIPLTQG